MKYKLVALDLDDTLLLEDQTIDPEARQKIIELNKKEVKFILATGRTYSAAIDYLQELKLTTPLICHNGAYVKTVEGEVLSHSPVPLEIAREILEYCAEHALEVCVYVEDTLYFRRRNELTRYYERISGIEGCVTNYPLAEKIDEPPTKILILEDDDIRQEYYQNELTSRYKKRLNITTSKPEFIEIGSGRIDKSIALQNFCQKNNISAREVVAIGNGFNDLSMIKWSGLGVAVENAPRQVKEAADQITASNEEGGVARMLEEVFVSRVSRS